MTDESAAADGDLMLAIKRDHQRNVLQTVEMEQQQCLTSEPSTIASIDANFEAQPTSPVVSRRTVQLVNHLQRPDALPVDRQSFGGVGTPRSPLHTDQLQHDGFRSHTSARTYRSRHPHLPVDKHNGEGSEDYSGFGSSRTTANQGTASIISFSSSMESSAVSGGSSTQQKQGEALSAPVAIMSVEYRLDRLRDLSHLIHTENADGQFDCTDLVQSVVKMMHPDDIWSHSPNSIDSKVLTKGTELLHAALRYQPDEKRRRRGEIILRVLKEIREYSLVLRTVRSFSTESDALARTSMCLQRVSAAITNLLKQSFDAEYRRITVFLGGLNAVAELLIGDWTVFGQQCPDSSVAIRRYIGMSLTNLTYGDIASKRSLCAIPGFLDVVIRMIGSDVDELRQVYASVLRNLSWKADATMRRALLDCGAVSGLIGAAMDTRLDATLKSVLSALWNLSSHSRENKQEICRHPEALGFLVSVLDEEDSPSSTAIVENASGILKYVSSQIAQREEYRAAVRQRGIFHKLLRHLQSTSLTVVTNACIVLCNLSAHNVDDQRTLLEYGARPMLQSLVNSRHPEIARFASLALTNLSSSWPLAADSMIDSSLSGQDMASSSLLAQRRQKTLERSFNNRLADVLSPMMAAMPDDSRLEHSSTSFASPRSHSARRQVLQLVGNVTCQVPSANIGWSFGQTDCSHASAADSYLNEPWSSKSADERSGAKPMPPTREEQMQQDRLAGQRFLSSFNKHSRRKEQQDKLTPDEGDCDEVKCFARKESRDHSPSSSTNCTRVPFSSAPTFAPGPTRFGDRCSNSSSTIDLRSVAADVIDETEKVQAAQPPYCQMEMQQQHPQSDQLHHGMMIDPPLSDSLQCTRSTSMQSLTSDMLGRSTFHSTVHSVCSTARTSRRMSPITFDDIPDSPTMLSRHNSVPTSPSKRVQQCEQPDDDDDDYATFEPRASPTILDASILAAMPAKKKHPIKTKQSEPSLNDLIQSAMPKPKTKVRLSSQHAGKSVAIAKPMIRQNPTAPVLAQSDSTTAKSAGISFTHDNNGQQLARNLSPSPTPQRAQNTSKVLPDSPPDLGLSNERQELLDECINCAMPKAKPKSRARRSQVHRSAPDAAQATETRAESAAEDIFQSPRKSLLSRMVLSNEPGILEASGSSMLIQSSIAPSNHSNANSLLMGFSGVSTTLEDMLPPDDLMQISAVSTGPFLRNSTTNEKVRDASSLYRQAVTAPPKRPNEQNSTDASGLVGTKTSTDSESLSEDNYSRIDDESFDIAPEDVNLSWVQEDAHHVLIELEAHADDDPLLFDDLLDDTEVTIDCETLSCVSSDSRSPRDVPQQSTGNAPGPKIVSAQEAATQQQRNNTEKLVRGGLRRSLGAVATPKMPPVRTTKSAQLRAKRNSESSTDGGGGTSVSPCAVLPRSSSSASNKGRASSVSVVGSGSSSTFTKTTKPNTTAPVTNTSTYTKTKPTVLKAHSANDDKKNAQQAESKPTVDRVRTTHRPPVPPKPGLIAKAPSEPPTSAQDKSPPKSAQSARVNPYNYQRPHAAQNVTKSKVPPPTAKRTESTKNSLTAETPTSPSDDSSVDPTPSVSEKKQTGPKLKQLLVTTV